MAEIMETKSLLAATIVDGDQAARRFAVFLGFHVADDGPGARATSRSDRRMLHHHLDTTPGER